MPSKKRNPLGPTGETVRTNVRRLRDLQNFGYADLERKLEDLGRVIPALGLRRIEAGERRVDADDLAALALALGVSPITLLMPPTASERNKVQILNKAVEARDAMRWLTGISPLEHTAQEHTQEWFDESVVYQIRSLPPWRSGWQDGSSASRVRHPSNAGIDPRKSLQQLEDQMEQLRARIEHGDD